MITTVAEPMESELCRKLHFEKKNVDFSNYWDHLAVDGLWCLGPEDFSTCALVNDILDESRTKFDENRGPFVKGFQWACRQGPLCDDYVYGTKIKLVNIRSDDLETGQIIPTMRKSCFNSILSASPRFVEPYLYYDVLCPKECFNAVSKMLNRRRGNVLASYAIPSTSLFCMKCQVPALDSFGCEVDIRMVTQGAAMVYSQFSHYQILESDPLLGVFQPINIEPLEPSPVQLLATDYLLKTRRRKGLGDEVILDDSLKMIFNV
eukprot:NODE_5_length_72347_cov_1.339331.p32 type:complete len:263 gc:universal NODE_5_length_72347_cov_1.339331:43359-42571(-)